MKQLKFQNIDKRNQQLKFWGGKKPFEVELKVVSEFKNVRFPIICTIYKLRTVKGIEIVCFKVEDPRSL